MTNEFNEELTKIAQEIRDITDNPHHFYMDWADLVKLRAKIRILNDLIRKINAELE